MSRTYEFSERLEWSRDADIAIKIKDLLLNLIPGAVDAHPAHRTNDLRGADWWVEHASGKHIAIDVKLRGKDYLRAEGRDDVALEKWSVKEKSIVGWTLDESKITEFVLWYWRETGRFKLVSFALLCGTFKQHSEDWCERYPVKPQFTPRSSSGYHSECVIVPWETLYRAMDEFSAGSQISENNNSNQEPTTEGLNF